MKQYLINSFNLTVRYNEIDPMGVVHNANYYVWFDLGRLLFFNEFIMPFKQMRQRENIVFPTVENSCKYLLPAKYRDILTIETKFPLENVNLPRFKFYHVAFRKRDSAVVARGDASLAMAKVSNDNFTLLLRPPDLLIRKISESLERHNKTHAKDF
jgi:acyl-CoA thioester hydrolase